MYTGDPGDAPGYVTGVSHNSPSIAKCVLRTLSIEPSFHLTHTHHSIPHKNQSNSSEYRPFHSSKRRTPKIRLRGQEICEAGTAVERLSEAWGRAGRRGPSVNAWPGHFHATHSSRGARFVGGRPSRLRPAAARGQIRFSWLQRCAPQHRHALVTRTQPRARSHLAASDVGGGTTLHPAVLTFLWLARVSPRCPLSCPMPTTPLPPATVMPCPRYGTLSSAIDSLQPCPCHPASTSPIIC